MSNGLDELIVNMIAYRDQIEDFVAEEIKEDEALICDMNSQEQLYDKGVNADGQDIFGYAPYRPETISRKASEGQPTDRVTLKDTGAFYRSFYIIFGVDSFYITASDPLTQTLSTKYSDNSEKDNIFGLTNENMLILSREYVLPYLLNRLRERFNLR